MAKKPAGVPRDRKRKLPKSKPKNSKTVQAFSPNGSGAYSNGGAISFSFSGSGLANQQKASRILKRYAKQSSMWQVSRKWQVTYTSAGGRTIRRTNVGFSKPRKPKQNSAKAVAEALADSAVNVARRQGLDMAYEGKTPKNVRSKERGFALIIWFKGKFRAIFIEA